MIFLTNRSDKVRSFIDERIVNLAERTFGEEFLSLAGAENMTARYKQSLRITSNGQQLILELDYRGDNDEPLGVWFEKGTSDHFIKPTEKKALSWIENGQRFFSKGHFVRGIPEKRIMERTVTNGLSKFTDLFKEEIKNG